MPYSPIFMNEAIALATENIRRGGGPFGAVVVRNGAVIARAANQVTTTNDPTAHAEILAIREACRTVGDFQLAGCELYTTCEPCPMCLGAIYWARPAQVYFACTRADAASAGFDDSLIYAEVNVDPVKRRIPMIQEFREEGLRVFEEWGRKQDKRQY
jgi:tRNA(Arg) A34 adenosine deaminase TadA